MNNREGFTLVEVIVVLAVIAILAAIAVPLALRIFERTAEDATREEMNNIKKALLGDPRKLQTSFRNDFGFLGDIGCLPTDGFPTPPALDRLATQGTYPGPTFDTNKQAGAGWKGPYITGTAGEDFTKDQWGNDYVYTAAGACPLTATLTSSGADLVSTSDDITVTIVANETTAAVRGAVKNTSGVGLASVPVEFYSAANNGVLTTTSGTTDANGNYSFNSVPFGLRAVKANPPGLVLVPGSVTTSGANNQHVNFQVTNYSGSSVQVASVNVVTCPGAVRFDDIQFDNSNVESPDSSNRPCNSNIALDLSDNNTIFSANATPPSSLRVVVDSPDTQLPDLTLRGGVTRTIELIKFENSGGSNVPMNSKTLTVTFNLVGGGSVTMTVTTP